MGQTETRLEYEDLMDCCSACVKDSEVKKSSKLPSILKVAQQMCNCMHQNIISLGSAGLGLIGLGSLLLTQFVSMYIECISTYLNLIFV